MGKRVYDWRAIQAYYDAGHGYVECQKFFGFSHTAWVKAIKRGHLLSHGRQFADRRRRYDWSAIQAYYDAGHSFRECQRIFGFCNASWDKAKKRGELFPRSQDKSLEQVLSSKSGRHWKKRRLIRDGLLEAQCGECGISQWRGRPLSVQIDHINGIRDDWRVENLRMLCPNCHSQTDTFAGRNIKRRRGLQEGPPPV